MANVLPPFPSFSVHEDNASVGPCWKKWLKRFEMYLAAYDVKMSRSRRRERLCEGRHCFDWLFSAQSKQDI